MNFDAIVKKDLKRFYIKTFLGEFLVLKLFPGDPIWDNPDFRDPLLKKKKAPEVFLIGGACFLIGGRDYCIW